MNRIDYLYECIATGKTPEIYPETNMERRLMQLAKAGVGMPVAEFDLAAAGLGAAEINANMASLENAELASELVAAVESGKMLRLSLNISMGEVSFPFVLSGMAQALTDTVGDTSYSFAQMFNLEGAPLMISVDFSNTVIMSNAVVLSTMEL